MTMTGASSQYFEKVARQWDELRSGFFSEAVRETAMRLANLRPGMVVADVGAGTGFITAGLASLVQRVYAIDGSPAMLQVARQNLSSFDNLVFLETDGLSIPLPDASLDAVFANMYLHHCIDPLAAIREMRRLLRSDGRLVITDMDAHPYAWLKEEVADVWQGFERSQVKAWFEAAGLVDVSAECTGQTCSARSAASEPTETGSSSAHVTIFAAVGTCPQAVK